ncbi:hypothetical protein SCA6_010744 [Theobroma cacao]
MGIFAEYTREFRGNVPFIIYQSKTFDKSFIMDMNFHRAWKVPGGEHVIE